MEIKSTFGETWRWRTIDQLNHLGLLSFHQGENGSLFFGHIQGLVEYDGKEWTSIKQLEGESVLAVHQHRTSEIYVRTPTRLLHSRDKRVWRTIYTAERDASDRTRIIESADGSLWVLANTGVLQVSDGQVIKHAMRQRRFDDFFIDDKQYLWLVEYLSGTLVRIPVSDNFLNVDSESKINFPYSIPGDLDSRFTMANGEDCIWLASQHPQIPLACYRKSSGRWQIVQLDSQGFHGAHLGVAINKWGYVYVWGEGFIAEGDGPSWQVYKAPDYNIPLAKFDLVHNPDGTSVVISPYSRSLWIENSHLPWGQSYYNLHFQVEGPTGYFWFTDVDGRVLLQNKLKSEWLRFDQEGELIEQVHALRLIPGGHIVALGEDRGASAIATFDTQQITSKPIAQWNWLQKRLPQLKNRVDIGRIHFRADGSFVVAGESVNQDNLLLMQVNDQQREIDVTPLVLSNHPKQITALAGQKDGTLWLVESQRLHVYRAGRPVPIPNRPAELEHGSITRILVDRSDRVWLATRFGIFCYDQGTWTRYNRHDGLDRDQIRDVSELSDGSILATAPSRIYRFDGQRWARFNRVRLPAPARGLEIRSDQNHTMWLNMSYNDFPWIAPDYSGNSQPSSKNKFFAALQYTFDNSPPETVILRYNKEVAIKGFNQVTWLGKDSGFGTRNFLLNYSWKLNDGPWSPFSNATYSVFEWLPSGKHTLQVRARDADFNIDPTPELIEFRVIPPLLQQTWFQLALFVAFLTVSLFAYVIVRLREKHLLETELMKVSFFTGISHELRTPLTIILGRLDQLLEKKQSSEDLKSLEQISRSASRLRRLVDQLLDFRRLERRQLKMTLTDVDVIGFSKNILESMRLLAEEKRINYQILLPDTHTQYKLDSDKYEKILTNLLDNAIKYTPEAGTIEIELNLIREKINEHTLQLIVEDSGVGILPEEKSLIFEQFYRAKNMDKVSGTGIGLALTRELLNLCSGEIFVVSPVKKSNLDGVEDHGSRFEVRLPIVVSDESVIFDEDICAAKEEGCGAVEEADRINSEKSIYENKKIESKDSVELSPDDFRQIVSSEVAKKEAQRKLPSLLIVEDEKQIRQLLKEDLHSEYEVILAENGAIGLEYTRQYMPDLVLTDLMMPEMNGLEFCDSLKNDELISHIPVIMLTARWSNELELRGLESGADDYIKKPFNMPVLRQRIKNLIEARRKAKQHFLRPLTVDPAEVTTTKKDEVFVQRAIEIAEKNIANSEFSVKEFAVLMNKSHQNLYEKLKGLTGQTPKDFIDNIRFERAIQLVRESGTSVTIREIASEVGFDDPGYFSRRFKQKFGISPTQLKKAP